jgi:hypothetical protein
MSSFDGRIVKLDADVPDAAVLHVLAAIRARYHVS